MAIIKDWLTESDNQTHDLSRVLAAVAIVVGLGLQIYAVGWKGQEFDMQSFGLGVGSLFAGLAALLGFKKESSNAP